MLPAGTARAELHDSVERLADAWRGVGASVLVDKTRFLTDDSSDERPVVITLPPLPEGECTTVVLLGARGLGFHVRLAEPNDEDTGGKRVPSVAGAVSIERCGGPAPRKIVVASDSGRGALETVLARSEKPLPSLRAVLPERSGGPLMPASEPGALPPLPAPEKRAEFAETRAKRDGAAIVQRKTWQAGADGSGGGDEMLDPGCHTLELFAPDPRSPAVTAPDTKHGAAGAPEPRRAGAGAPDSRRGGAGAADVRPSHRGKLDLDAEMRDDADDRLLARDRTDAPDAQLAVCVGEATRVDVVFAGSPPSAPVLVAHFAWPLPEHLPSIWGAEARGRMAHVLQVRHVASLPHEPVLLAQGGLGLTPIPLSIEPGACYLGIVTRAKEAARSLGLRIHVGATDAADDRGIDDDGAAVAFCAGDRSSALAEVEARGTTLLGWGFALYRLQSDVWEAPR
jgi:hypothetical protein